MGDVVDADPRPSQGLVEDGGHGRGSPRVGVLGHIRRVAAVRPAPEVDPPVGRDPQGIGPLVAGHDHGGGQVDVHHRHRPLGVGVGHHAVVRGRGHQLVGGSLDGEPGVGVGGGHPAHRGQQLTDPPPVAVRVDAEVGSAGHIPEGEGEVGLEDLVGHLSRVEGGLEREGARLGVPVAPVRLVPRLLQASFRGQGLTAADNPDIDLAGQDALREVGDQDLGRGPADPAVVAVAGLATEGRGQPAGGVVVGPALAVDDLEALDGGQQVGAGPGVGRRGAGRLLPQGQRLGPGAVADLGTDLGDADDAGGAGVDGHRGAHCPVQTGSRFSAKAFGPSLASSLAKTTPLSSASIL